jgi:mannose-6-phosphate isomerase-like protein (cupin superfamily)
MSSTSSSRVTPFSIARGKWKVICSVRAFVSASRVSCSGPQAGDVNDEPVADVHRMDPHDREAGVQGSVRTDEGLVVTASVLRDICIMTGSQALADRSFESFRASSLQAGADEVVERSWGPGQIVETHTHSFDADALVTEGEMWLTFGGETRHLRAGDRFHIPNGTPHSEKYGPRGATYWVARRNAR